MGRFLHLDSLSVSYTLKHRTFVSFWFCGLLFGVLFSSLSDGPLYEGIHSSLSCKVQFHCLLSALLMPLIITALSVFLSKLYILYLLAFSKALVFSFVVFTLLTTFESSAWLICWFAMFSDILLLPFLWWLWLRIFSSERKVALQLTAFSGIAILLVCSIDYFWISPFLASLL